MIRADHDGKSVDHGGPRTKRICPGGRKTGRMRCSEGLVLFCFLGLVWAASAEASAWTQPQGTLWWKVAGSWFSASEKFANNRIDTVKENEDGTPVEAGDRIPFDFQTGGRYRVATILIEAAYGVRDRLEVFAKAPWHSTVFTNDTNEVEPGSGIGDLRVGVAFKGFDRNGWVASASFELKLPTADLPRSIYQQPLGEGQSDWTLRLRGGRSLWPRGWLNAEAGYRWRKENEELQVDPGDEGLLEMEAGWTAHPKLAVKLAFSGLWGGQWIDTSFAGRQELGRRRLFTLGPALLYELPGMLTLELGAAFPLAGEDYPAGILWSVGLMGNWSPLEDSLP